MDFNGIKHLVFSSDVERIRLVNEAEKNGLNTYSFLDARSAIYGATGVSAQSTEKVIVCVNGDNASRSAYSGMTEAFYRNLPIILITVGGELNYSEELGDVLKEHYKVENETELEKLLKKDISLPAHIELSATVVEVEKKSCPEIQRSLAEVLTSDDYLYFSPIIDVLKMKYKCKVVKGGMANCFDGALSNVLGASLAKKHKRYVGIVTETEFFHDMNSLGNINVNDDLLYIVICDEDSFIIKDLARSFGFQTTEIKTRDINPGQVKSFIRNNEKSIMIINKGNE